MTVPIWTEYISDFDRLCYLAFPRFAAVAERGWTKTENLNYESFCRRFAAVTPLLNRFGVKPAPQIDWDPPKARRLTGTVHFFKDKIDTQAIKNSFGSTNQ